jgi:hypothetical protein
VPSPNPDLRVERTVSASAAEFWRGIKAAFPDAVIEQRGIWLARHGAVSLTVRYQCLPPLRVALLALPQLALRLEFIGGNAVEQQAMLERLDRYTHRGGG